MSLRRKYEKKEEKMGKIYVIENIVEREKTKSKLKVKGVKKNYKWAKIKAKWCMRSEYWRILEGNTF
jgi:hypothetical protein